MYLNDVKYPGGYLITPEDIEISDENQIMSVGNYKLVYDQHVYVEQYVEEKSSITLVGYCFDIRDGDKNQQDILKSLLKAGDIVEELEYINGRYFMVVNDGPSLMLYSDASQLQPLVYHKESKILASHDHMLSSYLSNLGIKTTKYDNQRHTELDFTRYKEIFKVNPSLALDLNQFNFIRIYPRNSINEQPVEEVFQQLKPYIDETIKWLKNNKQEKFTTITAGIDSRLSASLTREIKGMEYLTYVTPQSKLANERAREIYRIDEFITQQMKENLKWSHEIINISEYKNTKEDNQYLTSILNSRHSYGLRKYYREKKKYHHALHIKSTVFGMGKADFHPSLNKYGNRLEFYKKCFHGLPKTFTDKEENSEKYFSRNLVTEGFTKGRHYYDVFHLESRMGNWHSVLTLETDPETDEFIFTNCRKIADYIQMPSVSERRQFSLYKRIIEEYWPVLLFFGLNETETLYQKLNAKQIKYNNMAIEVNENITYELTEDKVYFKPTKSPVSFDDIFKICVVPETDQEIYIKGRYRNRKALGKIHVVIRTKSSHMEYDILEINKGIQLPSGEGKISVSIRYNGNFIKPSWLDAGRIILYNDGNE